MTTTTGSREMRVAAFLLFLCAMGAMALPWPAEDGYFGAERRPSGFPSYEQPTGDSLRYSFDGGSSPFDNDVGDEDDEDDDSGASSPSRGSPSAGYYVVRPGTRPNQNSDPSSILFPGESSGPSRYGPTRSPVSSRPTPVRGRNTPSPTNPRGTPGSRRPETTRPTPTQGSRNARPPTTTNSRRSQDCQRFRRLAREFKQNSTLSFKILGGNRAGEGEFPYTAALGFSGGSGIQFLCGGSLISERYILTAAHCITDARRQNLRLSVARLGVTTMTQGSSGPGDYAVEEATLHPDHDGRLRYNDVALLRLDRAVVFSAVTTPVCLPDADAAPTPAGENVLVAGWGATDALGVGMSSTLQKATLQVVERGECARIIGVDSALPRGLSDGMLCARDPAGQADTCSGDSGGPLVMRSNNGQDTLLGVTSFGDLPCGGRPGIYSMASAFISWIERIVWP